MEGKKNSVLYWKKYGKMFYEQHQLDGSTLFVNSTLFNSCKNLIEYENITIILLSRAYGMYDKWSQNFIMRLLQNSPDNRGMLTLRDIRSLYNCTCMNTIKRCLLEELSEDDWLLLTLTVIQCFDWLNDVTDLRHNAFATSASLNKTASAYHLFHCLFAIKSANNA